MELACPRAPGELYLARGTNVSAFRPLMTGDVFRDIEIPGVPDGPALAMVLGHPCSIREGAHLCSHIQMARVLTGAPIPLDAWRTGHFRVMPLPGLTDEQDMTHRAVFDLSGRVRSHELRLDRRLACLDDPGFFIVLQRIAVSAPRFVVVIDGLHATVVSVLDEATMLEDWLGARTAADVGLPTWSASVLREEEAFDAFMRQEIEGESRRKRLADPMYRSTVLRDLRATLRAA